MKYIVLFISYLLTLASIAGESNKSRIERVEVTTQFFSIYAKNGDFGKQECDSGNPIAFKIEDFPTNHNQFLSIALSAFAANKPVTMWLSGCQASPWSGTMPKPISIVIHHE